MIKGAVVFMTADAVDNYGEQYRNVPLTIDHVARNVKEHRGYDEGMEGQPLYDFEGINFSLYRYEVQNNPLI